MKENQPELLAALAAAFDDDGVSPRERRLAAAERQAATSTDKGHGRVERRTLTSATALSDRRGGKDPYLDWPYLGCRVRTGSAPFVLSILRNAAVTLLDQNPATAGNKAAAVRRHAAHPGEALALIRGYG